MLRTPQPRLLLLLVTALLGLADGIGAEPPGTLAAQPALQPLQISYSVTRAENSRWISLRADYEIDFPVPPEALSSILEDYERLSGVFTRIDWAKVVSRREGWVITEQRSGVKAFGIEFYTNLFFRNRSDRSNPGKVRVIFEQEGEAKTLINSQGYWDIEDRSSPAGPLSHLHYRIAFDTLAQYPGQETIMRNFGPGDIERTIKELGLAAEHRRALPGA